MDCKIVDSKVTHSKYAGSRNVGNEKVSKSLADFTLSLLLLSTKFCKECVGITQDTAIAIRVVLVLGLFVSSSLVYQRRKKGVVMVGLSIGP